MKKKLIMGCLLVGLTVGGAVTIGNNLLAKNAKADSINSEKTVNDNVKRDNVTKKESTVVGKLDIIKLYMDDKYSASEEKYVEGKEERTIRIWLPEGYDANNKEKRYPVLYMHDAQNLFDDATSFCGEWGIDETITDMMNNESYAGSIVVGIDNSDYREPEMKPTWDDNYCLADRYSEFIVNKVKSYVDANYNTLTDRANTGIGGSSMGGLISFYMGLKHPEIFGYEVCFSPAFCFVTEEQVKDYMEKNDIRNKVNPKIYMYCGGADLDNELYGLMEPIKNVMINNGYDSKLIEPYIDMTQPHNESAWRKYFPQAYKWLIP